MNPSVILLGDNEWSDSWQSHQYIARELAGRGWPVLYFHGNFTRWSVFTNEWRRASWRRRYETHVGVQVMCPNRWRVRWPRFRCWDDWVRRTTIAELRRAAGWDGERPRLALIMHPVFGDYLEDLRPCKVVYYADDTFRTMPGWNERLAGFEDRLAREADLVLATAPGVARHLPGARIQPNGADTERFARGTDEPTPAALAGIRHPRIGYMGVLNEKVDFHTLTAIARARPAWQIVLVGPFTERAKPQAAELLSLPNVHALGRKPFHELQAYVAHMDVNLLCYRTDPGGWWTDLCPLKLHEYLATGQPIVSCDLETVREFLEVVPIARGTADWVRRIEEALEGGVGTPGRRREIAHEHRWSKMADRLVELLLDAVGS